MQKRDLPLDCDGIILRRLTRADLLRFQAYRADPEVARYQGWEPMADEAALSFLQSNQVAPLFVPGSWNQLGISVAPSDEISGNFVRAACARQFGRDGWSGRFLLIGGSVCGGWRDSRPGSEDEVADSTLHRAFAGRMLGARLV